MLGPECDLPLCDGWEHAGAYRYMLERAKEAKFVMVMPDLLLANGSVSTFTIPYCERFWAMVDCRRPVRAHGFIGFAIGSHEVVKQRVPTQSSEAT